jgi:hypothetical protein
LFTEGLFERHDLSHLSRRAVTLGIVASKKAADERWTPHRTVVVEPVKGNRVRVLVRRMDGSAAFEGTGTVTRQALRVSIPVSLPHVPLRTVVRAELSNDGRINVRDATVSLRTSPRPPSRDARRAQGGSASARG